MKVIIFFAGDPSVGMNSYYFEMTIPKFEEEHREETRTMIKELYTELDGEFTPQIFFGDEDL